MNTIHAILLLINISIFPAYENAKKSFGFIHDQIALVKKNHISPPADIMKDAIDFNKTLMDLGTMRASGFVYSHKQKVTQIVTNDHVCKDLDLENKNPLALRVIGIVQNKLSETNPLLFLYFDLKYRIVVTSFAGIHHEIMGIEKSDKKTDLCILNTKDVWGSPAEINETECIPSEEVYNISASGGLYYPGAFPIRKGFYNGIVLDEYMTDNVYKTRGLYTLNIQSGASGSAVFNSKGKICGNISHTVKNSDVSFGSTVEELKTFLR